MILGGFDDDDFRTCKDEHKDDKKLPLSVLCILR